jgi:hypothetical protein
MNDTELIDEIEAQRSLMVAVATGGPRIDSVNHDYIARRRDVRAELDQRGLEDPNPYADLWAWYGKWSSGDLPSWRSRREYLAGLYRPLVDRIRQGRSAHGVEVFGEPTGWAKVDRAVGEMRRLLEQASSEEQFQAVGLFCREILISVAQAVYDPNRHPTTDGVEPSETDVKRMLEAFMNAELAGGANEVTRRYARAAFDLANGLQHRRTATFRQAATCAQATAAVVNLVAITSGQRDPEVE